MTVKYLKNCQSICVLLVFVLLNSCFPRTSPSVEAKVFFLTPAPYLGRTVKVNGKIKGMGPGKAYFVIEDRSGSILVTTERIVDRLSCEQGWGVALEGVLRQYESTQDLYFSAERLLECSDALAK